MSTDSRNINFVTIVTMLTLYAVIILLPFFIELNHEILMFLEQPLLILLPTFIASLFYMKVSQKNFTDFFKLKALSGSDVVYLTVIILLLPGIVGFTASISDQIFSGSEMLMSDILFDPSPSDTPLRAIGIFFYGLFFTAVFPGICEEFLFRGALLSMMEKVKLKKWTIVLLNAALFSIFHWTFVQLLYTFVMGIIVSLIVMITKSIWAGIYVHIGYNFIVDLSTTFSLEKFPVADAIDYVIGSMENVYMAVISSILIFWILSLMKKERC